MDLLDALQTYFRGEKMTGLGLVPVGVVVSCFAGLLWRTESGGFRLGVAVPLLVIGLAGIGGGAGLAIRTARQVPALEQTYRADARAMVAQELPRMARVNRNWPRFKAIWTVMAALALVLLWAGGRPWTAGLGVSLLLVAALLVMIDVFAERRAILYTWALEHIAQGP